ncbi:MAG: hypothetical protein ACI8WB_001845 [Phenylobacterium sp.]|jgi:hypothetical protein
MKSLLITISTLLLTLLCTISAYAFPPLCGDRESPLIIDLGQDGLHLGSSRHIVSFDILGSGEPVELQWVKAGENDAFLAIDLDEDGVVTDGRELFGNGTRMKLEDDALASNGFIALEQYDKPLLGGNDDGYISEQDEIWPSLSLWTDVNADGISTPDEMQSVADHGLTHLSTMAKVNNRYDRNGNRIPFWSWVINDNATDNKKYKMFDVFFRLAD